jgi:alcohol dehydrogenase
MAILLPHCMEFNADVCADEYGSLLLPLAGAETYAATSPAKRPAAAIAAVRGLLATCTRLGELPTTLSAVGVTEAQLPDIARVAIDDASVSFNPRDVSLEDALGILKAAL